MKQSYILTILLALVFLSSCKGVSSQEGVTEVQHQQANAQALSSQIVLLVNNSRFDLVASRVEGPFGTMFAYNNQFPGPLLKVAQGSTVQVNVTNNLDMPTSVHWHGLRLENEYDGAAGLTQDEIMPKMSFNYVLSFPDSGIYWYHAHVREDVQQERGLYGAILIEAQNSSYNNVDQEEVLLLDDVALDGSTLEKFGAVADHALMGRFGNVMVVNGQTNYSLSVRAAEVVRFYFIDAANTRVFNVSIKSHLLKVVGSDGGLLERDYFANSTVVAPGERSTVEVLFDAPGTYQVMHKTPESEYVLGSIVVEGTLKNRPEFEKRARHPEVTTSIDPVRMYFNNSPDIHIDAFVEMGHGGMMMGEQSNGMMRAQTGEIEWEDDMVMMNRMSTSKTVRWVLKDEESGLENMDLNYSVRVGDVKLIRINNDPTRVHPMQHPLHLHGQRFLVLRQNGVENKDLAWKDTVLVTPGVTDILVQFTNEGKWMFHCHIAEHLESGMMTTFYVLPKGA